MTQKRTMKHKIPMQKRSHCGHPATCVVIAASVCSNASVAIVLIANAAKMQMGHGNAVTVYFESRIANGPTCEAFTSKTLKNICTMQTLSPAA